MQVPYNNKVLVRNADLNNLKVYKTRTTSISKSAAPAETNTKNVLPTCLTEKCPAFFHTGI